MARPGAASRRAPEAIAIGALIWDVIATASGAGPLGPGGDVPGRVVCRPGGVALNLALALHRAGIATAILAQIGADAAGRALMRAVARQGVATHALDPVPGVATGRYVAIEAGGRLVGAVADTEGLEGAGGAAILAALEDGRIARPEAPWRGIAVVDGNLPAPLLDDIATKGWLGQADLRLCAPSPAKARRLVPLARLPRATLYLNRAEAEAFCGRPLADARAAAAALAPLTPEAVAARGLEAAEAAEALPLARLAVLFEAAALGRLHASRRLQQRVERLRRWWQVLVAAGEQAPGSAAPGKTSARLEALAEGERLLLQRQLEEELPALLLLLPPEAAAAALERWRDTADPLFHPRPPLDGHQLQQALALPPGRLLGELLTHLSGERAFGRLAADANREQTVTLARHWLTQRDGRRD